MSLEFHVIIPARYASSRLPGKLLMDIHGQTVIERVYRQALKAAPTSLTIATDSEKIVAEAERFGATVLMTSAHHPTGSDRLAEAVSMLNLAADAVVVNVQGDEPFIPPALIRQVAHSLVESNAPMATLCTPLHDLKLAKKPHTVKVVRNRYNQALYFSRSLIPMHRDAPEDISHVYGHIGLYAYRAAFLQEMVTWPACTIESAEALEQLRVLWSGYAIQVDEACVPPMQDINTSEDLALARETMVP